MVKVRNTERDTFDVTHKVVTAFRNSIRDPKLYKVEDRFFPVSKGILSGPQYEYMKANVEKSNANLKVFWISQGGEEDIAHENCRMMRRFDDMGIEYQYSEYTGGHTWPVWRHDLLGFSQLIF